MSHSFWLHSEAHNFHLQTTQKACDVQRSAGPHSSGLRWSERLADVLREIGFFTSHCEKDGWMRDKGDHHEHIAVCVDDLLIASKDPELIVKMLMEKHQFKLKGAGPTKFHLGFDFFRDEEGVPCCAPKKHIEKFLENCRQVFGAWPKPATSPLTAGDHPKLDTSEPLNEDNQKVHQSSIGAPQWVIQIGRFNVQTAVMTVVALCQDKDTLTASRESMGVFLGCDMLRSRPGLAHLII